MERKLILLALGVALLGCGQPEGSSGETMNVGDLNKKREATMKDDGLKGPVTPTDSVGTPGGGKK